MKFPSVKTHHTTQLAALVSAAGAFLVAALLTSEDELFWNRGIERVRREMAGGVRRAPIYHPSADVSPSSVCLSPSFWIVTHGTS